MPADDQISDSYRASLRIALIFSAIIMVLSLLMLDGGQAARLTAGSLLIFWSWVLVGIWLRPRNPTSFDLLLIRWGCLPLVVGFQVAIHVVWHLRGLE